MSKILGYLPCGLLLTSSEVELMETEQDSKKEMKEIIFLLTSSEVELMETANRNENPPQNDIAF